MSTFIPREKLPMTEAVKADKKAEKKNKIVETAIELFSKNSVSGIAIDDIVKACGIARGTFYLYFKDKSDLLEQIIMIKSRETMMGMLTESLASLSEGDFSFIEMARLYLNNFVDFLEKNKDTLTIIQKNISIVMKNAPDFGDELTNSIFEAILDNMVDYGYTRSNAIMTIYIIVDMVGSACSDAILTGKPYSLEEIRYFVIETAIGILEHGKELPQNNEGKEVTGNEESNN